MPVTKKTGFEIDRRSLLSRFGAAGVMGSMIGASAMPQALAGDGVKQGVHVGSTKLPKFFGDKQGAPGIIDIRPPFDLSDPVQKWAAVMKITSNLVGVKSYVPIITRAFILPENQPAIPVYGHMGFWTWMLQKPDPEEFPDAEEGQLVQRALYTGRTVHPWTYEPVDELLNPITGKMVKTEPSAGAATFMITPAKGLDYYDRETFGSRDDYVAEAIKNGGAPFIRNNDKISALLADIHRGEGDHQPRGDTSFWTVNYNDLMDPDTPLIKTDYSLSGIQRARVQTWLGLEEDDQTQLMWGLKGEKVFSVDDFPEQIREWAISEHPDRL